MPSPLSFLFSTPTCFPVLAPDNLFSLSSSPVCSYLLTSSCKPLCSRTKARPCCVVTKTVLVSAAFFSSYNSNMLIELIDWPCQPLYLWNLSTFSLSPQLTDLYLRTTYCFPQGSYAVLQGVHSEVACARFVQEVRSCYRNAPSWPQSLWKACQESLRPRRYRRFLGTKLCYLWVGDILRHRVNLAVIVLVLF